MKSAVITINIGTKYAKMAALTIPTHQAYAQKIGADFIEINQVNLPYIDTDYSAYWAKFELHKYLDEYDRIIYLDLDTVVLPHCPNLLEVVPESAFGALYETDFGLDQTEEITDHKNKMPDIEWEKDYFNVGVMVMSKCHQPAFVLTEQCQGGKYYPEQTLLNYNVQKLNFAQFHLDGTYNHMFFLNLDNSRREQSNILHYAAIPQEVRELLIADDLSRFEKGDKPLVAEELPALIAEKIPGKQFEDFLYQLYKDEEIGLS
ncbi:MULTISPECIES: glycosyltransferase [unclassified Pseudoalteromonas]|uniref:glycosyltransferase n=1 Tax=unclassified Pseudoalteromonas TaxID=194690 RepID=UPI002097C883|nr:glycosyltransferase [Pseudoalteromonas sp. XMcav2-N]MCO7191015.1 hypothetical protein [Pseudoalteromonas sp. XMcav2-N]